MSKQQELQPEESIPCSVCREPIRLGARKCIHCDSMLDWRGWLGISQTTLALLVALVSVVSASASRVAELFARNYSEVTLNVRQVAKQYLELAAWNQGNKNAQLLSANISAQTSDGKQLAPIELEVDSFPPVFAGQQAVFAFMVPLSEIPNFLAWPHKEIQSARMTARVIEFGKQAEDRTIELPPRVFRLFCRATEDADNQQRHPGQIEDVRLMTHCQ